MGDPRIPKRDVTGVIVSASSKLGGDCLVAQNEMKAQGHTVHLPGTTVVVDEVRGEEVQLTDQQVIEHVLRRGGDVVVNTSVSTAPTPEFEQNWSTVRRVVASLAPQSHRRVHVLMRTSTDGAEPSLSAERLWHEARELRQARRLRLCMYSSFDEIVRQIRLCASWEKSDNRMTGYSAAFVCADEVMLLSDLTEFFGNESATIHTLQLATGSQAIGIFFHVQCQKGSPAQVRERFEKRFRDVQMGMLMPPRIHKQEVETIRIGARCPDVPGRAHYLCRTLDEARMPTNILACDILLDGDKRNKITMDIDPSALSDGQRRQLRDSIMAIDVLRDVSIEAGVHTISRLRFGL